MFLSPLQGTGGLLIGRHCRHAIRRRRREGKRASVGGIQWVMRGKNLDPRWLLEKSGMTLVTCSYGRSVWKLWRALLDRSVCAIED